MTWRIVVKPTSYNLTSYTWTAQRSDNEAFLMSSMPVATKEEAQAEAKAEVTEWEQRWQIVQNNTVVVEEFDPEAL